MSSNALDILKSTIPQSSIHTDEQSLLSASFDGLKISFRPEALLKPSSASEIGSTLKLANEHKIPVTTRGAASTLTGAATPIKHGWVLDLSALNKIKIDPISRNVHVQAGTITKDIQQEAQKYNLFYPIDPSSAAFSTIGGNIACNAGGLRSIKYGVTRDYVVAVKGFLPTGEEVSWALPLKKFSSGYNIRDLWIGSEGTLGVITEATLKLIPKPETIWTALAAFKDESPCLIAVHKLLEKNITPSALEFMDKLTVVGTEDSTDSTLFPSHPNCPLLIIELDGSSHQVSQDQKIIKNWAKEYADALLIAETPEETDNIWHVRRSCSKAMFKHGNTKLNEDIVVPVTKTVELLKLVKELSSNSGLKLPTFGHLGDGNFHVNIMYNHDDPKQIETAKKAVHDLMAGVVKLGGAISGEHGIGLAKSAYLKLQFTTAEVNTMLAIKKSLDPNNILNPGKIFEEFHPWDYETTDLPNPWEKKDTF